ncbi:hypothetical protein [Acetobacteroides hydrogenigenes]|uniref:Uncharacterized protein n=1 Tax=Acetobacteroides hydrogenigenes TaxID=979970 RepID=A0A4R2E7N5_9BACT|nr:hypothetical protein [Acetobacteroides hydrogenigenes]TCN61694.1 hypothetical protein CLV25_1223 [Acetobacteroides hydrogenigenes]
MVGNCYAHIKGGNPYAYVVVLVLLLTPMLGWGQACPSFSTNYNVANASVSGTQGVPNDGTSYIRSGSLTVNSGGYLVVSGKLEITGSLVLNDPSQIVVCETGKLVVRGGVTLNKNTTISVYGKADPSNPTDYIGGLLIVLGAVNAANNGNIDLNNGGNVILAGGASSANIINSQNGDTYVNPIPGGNTSDIKNFDQLVKDPIFEEFQEYACAASGTISLSVSPGYTIASGTSVTITATTTGTFSSYSFYIGGATTPAYSGTSKVFTTALLQNGDVVTVYGRNGSCFKSASTGVFSVTTTPAKPTTPTGATPICQGTLTSTVQTTATSGASTYAWSIVQQSGTISPGTISGTGTSATITWNPLFSGVALVGVTGVNASSTSGPPSDALSITVNPQPAPVLGSTAICAGSSIALGTSGSYSSYSWTVTTTGFSLINATTPAPTLTAPDNDTLFPIGTTDIVAYPNVSVTVTDSNGCSATVTNNSTDRQVAVFRIPRTGAPYHISNVVAK